MEEENLKKRRVQYYMIVSRYVLLDSSLEFTANRSALHQNRNTFQLGSYLETVVLVKFAKKGTALFWRNLLKLILADLCSSSPFSSFLEASMAAMQQTIYQLSLGISGYWRFGTLGM